MPLTLLRGEGHFIVGGAAQDTSSLTETPRGEPADRPDVSSAAEPHPKGTHIGQLGSALIGRFPALTSRSTFPGRGLPIHNWIPRRGDGAIVALMATLYYGNAVEPIHIEDRALAHLKIVIATKLRRQESFTLSWEHFEGEDGGRSTIWIHPSIPLRFTFEGTESPQINPRWIEKLMNSVNSTGGIALVDEILATPEPDA